MVGACLRLIVEVEAELRAAGPRLPLSGFLFGLAALTRPDGLLIGACAYAAIFLTMTLPGWLSWRRLMPAVTILCLLVLAHLSFRLLYYGDWLPNTYHAKVGGRSWWSMGATYAAMFALEYAAYLWLPLLAAAVLYHIRCKTHYLPAVFGAVILPHLLYIVSIGGDHFEYRPLDLYFPFLFLLMRDGAEHLCRSALRAAGALCCLAAALARLVLLPYRTHALYPLDRYRLGSPGGWAQQAAQPFLYREDALLGLPDLPGLGGAVRSYLGLLREATGSFVGLRAEEHADFLDSVAREGIALRRLVERGTLPPDTYIAIDSVGAIPYLSRLRTLDRRGLTDREVARTGFTGEGLLAHEKQASVAYAAARGVDLWALDHVHLLWWAEDPDFVSLVTLAHQHRSPAYVAEVEKDLYLLALLPQGLPAARARLPGVAFRSVRDPGVIGDLKERARPLPAD